MKTMQEATPRETGAIRQRALKSFAMGRIDKTDCDYITTRLDQIDARVASMDNKEETA